MNAEFQSLPIRELHPSPTNPRRRFDDKGLTELAASIKKDGVLVPILARPQPEGRPGFEVVAGERRYRAAKKAGLEEIPARVREMSDEEALRIQVIENLQREDVHPLEEGLGYKALMERAGYDVHRIAKEVSKSVAYVYARLKLADLHENARAAFLQERISASHAVLIARLQPADQTAALQFSTQPNYAGVFPPVRDLEQWIAREVHLDLSAAPWKTDDATLAPEAGACKVCPKRAGTNPELNPGLKPETCMDRGCYNGKLQAFVKRQLIELRKDGEALITLTTRGDGKPKDGGPLTWGQYRELNGKSERCESAVTGVWIDGTHAGQSLTVCADRTCKKHAGGIHGPSNDDLARAEARIKADREKRKRTEALHALALHQILAKVREPLGRDDVEMVAASMFERLGHDTQGRLFKRHEWPPLKQAYGRYTEPARERMARMSAGELARLLVEMALVHNVYVAEYYTPDGKDLKAAAKRYRVDVDRIERDLKTGPAKKAKGKGEAKKVQTSAEKAGKKKSRRAK